MIKQGLKKSILGIVSLMMLCSCYDYTNWKKVEIPTDTPLRATVKIPNEWEFRKENGWISIYDNENENIVAQQFSKNAWEYNLYKNDQNYESGTFKVLNWDELEINPQLMYEAPKENIFVAIYGASNNSELVKNKYVPDIYYSNLYIYSSKNADDGRLQLMFNKNIEYEVIRQFLESSYFGGHLEY